MIEIGHELANVIVTVVSTIVFAFLIWMILRD
jgi:hypothetical protein